MREKHKIHVLLADDERLARESMRDYLPWKELGMEIPVCVENGELALDYLCTHPVDLFIMDIRMPVMDGMKLLEEIGRRNLDILIIVLSAYDQFEYAQKAIQSRRVFEYVLKPIKRKDFCGILEKAASEISRNKGLHGQEDLAQRLGLLHQEYSACARHHQLDDAQLLLERGLGEEFRNAENLEIFRHFLVSLYTELQLIVPPQPSQAPRGHQHDKICLDVLRTLDNSESPEQLLANFYQAVQELRPYLDADRGENLSKTTSVIRHCLEEIQKLAL